MGTREEAFELLSDCRDWLADFMARSDMSPTEMTPAETAIVMAYAALSHAVDMALNDPLKPLDDSDPQT